MFTVIVAPLSTVSTHVSFSGSYCALPMFGSAIPANHLELQLRVFSFLWKNETELLQDDYMIHIILSRYILIAIQV